MALGTFVAGAYTSTLNAVAMGLTRTGYELQVETKAELINETDAYGLTTIDWISRGADCFMQFTCREWKAGPIGAAWQTLGAALGILLTAAAPIARLGSDMAQALVLTSTTGTPAAAAPATLTASKAALAPNFNVNAVFDSRLREVPLRFQLLPYTSSPSTTLIFLSTT